MGKPDSRELLGGWTVPFRGVLRTLPPRDLPPDSLYLARNVLVRDGVLRPRPGLKRVASSLLDTTTGVPLGAYAYTTGDNKPLVVVGTTTGLYSWSGTTWQNRTQIALTGTAENPVRFTAIQVASEILLVASNGHDPMVSWNGIAPTFTAVPGLPVGPPAQPGDPVPPPRFTDLTTAGRRVIGLLPPYTVRWGNTDSVSQWPLANVALLYDTPDPLVAIRPLGTLGVSVYKRQSIYAGFFQGGSNAAAFRFELRGLYEGPAAPAAIVDVSGMHFYLTPTGRIASFNGSQHQWLADGLWPLVRDGFTDTDGVVLYQPLDGPSMFRAFGVYDVRFHEVTFFYPRQGDGGLPKGIISLSLPRPGTGKDVLGGFPGDVAPLWGGAVTAAVPYQFSDGVSRLALFDATSAKQVYNLDGLDDAGAPFPILWQTGLVSVKGMDSHRIDAIESFFERDAHYGSLTLTPFRSYSLAIPGGEPGPAGTINLEERQVRPLVPIDQRGRFFGVRYSATPTQLTLDGGMVPVVRWHGALLYGHRDE